MKLLIIEDDSDLSKILQKGFTKKGYVAEVALDGPEGCSMAFVNDYDLIILDLNLPGMDGLEVLSSIRQEKPDQRILILSARSEVEDRVKGLNLGANDYLSKPFDFGELDARVRALLRREFSQTAPVIRWRELSLNTMTKALSWGDSVLNLPPKEFAILEYLLYNVGRIVSTEDLIEHVWHSDVDLFSVTIKPHMSRLRKKLSAYAGSEVIITVRGSGYLIPKEDEP